MKGFLVFLTLVAIASALSSRSSEIVPIHETREWQEAFPEAAALIPKNTGRIWGGVVVENSTVIPHQVNFYKNLLKPFIIDKLIVVFLY